MSSRARDAMAWGGALAAIVLLPPACAYGFVYLQVAARALIGGGP